MKNFKFSQINKFCINLVHSKDRREFMVAEFKKIGLKRFSYISAPTHTWNPDIFNTHVNFFSAVDRSSLILPELSCKYKEGIDSEGTKFTAIGALACLKSHLEVMKFALSEGMHTIFICEDDIVFCDDFNERMDYIESLTVQDKYAQQTDHCFTFDLLSLGGHYPSEKPGLNESDCETTDYNRIYRTKALNGSYGYIITKPVMEFILRNATYQYGMDQFLSDFVYKRFNCYSFLPFLIGHKRGKSEITGLEWHYENADWYYEQEKVNINELYKNHILLKQHNEKKKIDDDRENYLKNNL